jgi:hypothetical protein
MAIASGASDGIRADSAAKESAGAAATLGSQSGAAADAVIVPDAITANNEGQLMVSPVYPGRMFCLRPWQFKLVKVAVNAGGSGHAVDDVLTVSGGVAIGAGASQVTVTAVNAGAVTEVAITRAAGFELRREGMTSSPSPPGDAARSVATTSSGAGTGCTLFVTFAPHFELRFITADASNTLTVHEPWIVPPVSGDAWAVSYILEDYATLTGMTLRAQSGVFECTRRVKVGPSTDATRHGWLAMNDGKALELDNVTDNALEVANGGVLTIGYTEAGESVNGAYISTSGTGGADFGLNTNIGGLFYIHDLQIRSPREGLGWLASLVGDIVGNQGNFRKDAGCIVKNTKLFDVNNPFAQSGYKLRDAVLQRGGSSSVFGIDCLLDGTSGLSGDSLCDINRVTLVGLSSIANTGGFRSLRGTFTSTVTFDLLRNITFLASERFVEVEQNETWQFVNPVWSPDLTGQVSFDFVSTTGSSIEQLMSLIVRPVDVNGDPVSGVRGYIYEGALNDNLPQENTERSLSGAYAPLNDDRFNDDVDEGEIVYFCDVLDRVYTPNGTTDVITTLRGLQAWRGYSYGLLPAVVSISINLVGGLDVQVGMLADDAISEADQATAITNPTTNPTVTKHGPGETDTRPMKALGYDAGTGAVAPSLGEVLTQGTATGVVVAVEGDDVSGTVLMDTWNGTEFTDNQNITGGTSAFDATTNILGVGGFYDEYTWEVDGGGEAMTVIYDYLAARMAEDPVTAEFLPVLEWGGTEPLASQLLFLGPSGYFTPRALRGTLGLLQDVADVTDDFSDNFNRANEALSASANWEAVLSGLSDGAVVSNQFRGSTGSSDDTYNRVDVSAHAYGPDQYVRYTVAAIPTASFTNVAACVRMQADGSGFYAATVRRTSTNDLYRLHRVEITSFTGGSAVFILTELDTTATVPSVNDVVELVAVGPVIKMYVNGTLECEALDDQFTEGQPGLWCSQSTTADTVHLLDDFSAGDFATGAHGEGVWIHNRGAGTIAGFESDNGAIFTPPVQVNVTLTGMEDNTEVRVCAAGDPDTELAGIENAVGGSPGNRSFTFALDAGTDVDIIVFNIDWILPPNNRIDGFTIPGSDTSIPISQVFDRNMDNPA